MDDDSVVSNRSYGDANSIASEEMSAFIAEVTAKHPSDLLKDDTTPSPTLKEDTLIVQQPTINIH